MGFDVLRCYYNTLVGEMLNKPSCAVAIAAVGVILIPCFGRFMVDFGSILGLSV